MVNSTIIINLLSDWVELYIAKKALDYSSDKKLSNALILSQFMILLIVSNFEKVIGLNQNYSLLTVYVGTFLIYSCSYKVNRIKGVIVTLGIWLCIIIASVLSIGLLTFISPVTSFNDIIGNTFANHLCIVIENSILFCLVKLYKSFSFNEDEYKPDALYYAIPILLNIIIVIVFFDLIVNNMPFNTVVKGDLFIICLLFFISNVVLLLGTRKLLASNMQAIEIKNLKNKLDAEYRHYTRIEKSNEEVKRLYHDMKNHIICVKGLYDRNENYKKYIDEIDKRIELSNYTFDTGSNILDILLYDISTMCIEKRIKFSSTLNIRGLSFIKDFDLCSIFSNILKNAYEACENLTADNKYISLKGRFIGDMFIINCVNSKENNIVHGIDSSIKTTKKNKKLHGIGLKSVKSSVKLYNGTININHTEKEFTVSIIIPIPLEETSNKSKKICS